MNPRRIASILVAAVLLQVAPSAERGARAAEPSSSPKTAEDLANEAYAQHTEGRFAEAIATYLKVYELSKAGAVLFNVAAIYDRKLHERALAMDYYRRYIGAPDAEPELVGKATVRLTALKSEADAESKSAAMLPTTPSPAPPPARAVSAPAPPLPPVEATEPAPDAKSGPSALRTSGVVVGAVGVAGVGASLILGLLAKQRNDDANAICDGPACQNSHGVGLAKDAGTFATASTVSFVAGLSRYSGGASSCTCGGAEARGRRARSWGHRGAVGRARAARGSRSGERF